MLASQPSVWLLLWVDDFLLMYQHEQTATAFLARLRQRFNIPTVGPLSHFLGMDIKYKPESRQMVISQEHTVDVLLERAKMQDCNPAQTPCPAGTVFSKKDCPTTPSPRTTEYASLTALANYLACWTRPATLRTLTAPTPCTALWLTCFALTTQCCPGSPNFILS